MKLKMAVVIRNLENIIPKENIKCNEPMSKHTTFKTGGKADCYLIAKTIEEVKNVVQYAKNNDIPIYIIGNGSNILVLDKGIRGIVLKIAIEDIKIEEKENDNIIVSVGAGTKMMALAQMLKQKGIQGFEELAGIPGTIGGANRMNAGAYGKEIKDIIIKSKCLNKATGNIEYLSNKEQQLVYRGSIFTDNKYVILETVFSLNKGNEKEIQKKMQEYLEQRKAKQPLEYPSAGSTFKRKDNLITAKLIDECGLKGFSIGGAQISEKHAGFIINKSNATSKDIIDLIEYTKKKVFEKFNVNIEEEVEIIGEE